MLSATRLHTQRHSSCMSGREPSLSRSSHINADGGHVAAQIGLLHLQQISSHFLHALHTAGTAHTG